MKNLNQNKFNIKLGAVIRKLREEQELSRHALAEISGVNEKYIGKIERGESSPSCFILKKLSLGLKTELTEIIKTL
jgi:transcriptional regulator with XRE-family HTH domain